MPNSLFNRLLGVVLIVVVLGAGGRVLWFWLDQPIQSVQVDGQFKYIHSADLSRQLSRNVTGQHWLSVNLNALREQALQIPWVDEARITRVWPRGLKFELQEQRPVAWWNDNYLLNDKGESFQVLNSGNLSDDMPYLAGPDERGADVLGFYRSLEKRLKPLGMTVTQVRLEARGAWRFQVNNNFWVVPGRGDLDVRVQRFIVAWQRALSKDANNIRYVDLRYPNGLAVGWHGETHAP
ncbi:cell division protein FtsQ/DivIB [Carnimonas nigrificans]|uniref:cell division protein FtsQ/DivIB n=1 Tax=Carnimonas nigrificans TaxID=64323 RepID=UPI0004706852|nr:cell division protein FtsQ/DivIB [Carnimonas nigrificans]